MYIRGRRGNTHEGLKTGCRCEVGEVLHVGWEGEFS